jgi:hypothetical protein
MLRGRSSRDEAAGIPVLWLFFLTPPLLRPEARIPCLGLCNKRKTDKEKKKG